MTTQAVGVNFIWLFPRNGIVRKVYKNDPGKLAACTSASHIEKPPKKTETPS